MKHRFQRTMDNHCSQDSNSVLLQPNITIHPAVVPVVIMLLLLVTGGCASKQVPSPKSRTYDSAKIVSATKVGRTSKVNRSSKGSRVVSTARSLLGIPYRWGGRSPETGFDCSGFIWYVYNRNGINLPRSTSGLLTVGRPVGKSSIRAGDILLYKVSKKGKSLHAAIATGSGTFVHSPSSGKTVCEVSMSGPYWRGRLIEARRVF
ncbi:C40 family peptidase [Maridesulfovibrio sp.]|uniref:C40 family peptidase n=1 Tax=Maridesulfovibrio sp. TaxID=2795000 RepID=UPI002A1874DF|nr:C40 family peptidase [Maridesulfovibrio sp.]